jgi:hypothetical protein
MADQAEAPEPTTAEKIAQMKRAGYVPPQASQAPMELTTAQKIAQMKAAGYTPPPSEDSAMNKNINPLAGSGLPLVDSEFSGNDVVHGAINALPTAGGVVGGVVGTGLGAAGGLATGGAAAVPMTVMGAVGGARGGATLGSYAKDALDNLIYGKQKNIVDVFRDAHTEGVDAGNAAAGGEIAGVVVGAAAKAALATNAGTKVASLVSAVPASLVKTYADGAERIKAALGSANGSIQRMGQAAKEQYVTDLVQTRNVLGKQVEAGVAGSTEQISVAPILAKLEASKASLSKDLDPGQMQSIQEMIDRATKIAGDDNKLSLPEAAQLTKHFQGIADSAGAYGKPGMSSVSDQVGNAAKGAGAVTRETMNKVAPDAVVSANKKLSTLHTIEDNMNKALLNPRKSASPLISAGEGESAAGAKNLADLQDMQAITGTDMTGPAQDVAAASALGKYKFTPSFHAPWSALGQPAVKGAIDASTALAGGTSKVPAALGQAVMHGAGALNLLQKPGE